MTIITDHARRASVRKTQTSASASNPPLRWRVWVSLLVSGCLVPLACWLNRRARADGAGPRPITAAPAEVLRDRIVARNGALAELHASQSETPTAEVVPETPPPGRLEEDTAGGPFAFLERTREELKILYEAKELVVSRCMKDRGFEYAENAFGAAPDLSEQFVEYRPGNVEAAESIGYGIAQGIEVGELPPPSRDANAAQLASMKREDSAKWQQALLGPPRDPRARLRSASPDPNWVSVQTARGRTVGWYRGSCVNQAQRAIRGDELAYKKLQLELRELTREAAEVAERDSAVVSGLRAWKTCIQVRGLEYDEPGAGARDLEEKYAAGKIDLETLRSKEVAVASADARCYRDAGLPKAYSVARDAAQQQLAEQNAQTLQQFQGMQRDELKRARELLAGAGR